MATSIGNLIAFINKTRLKTFRTLNLEMYTNDKEAKNRISALKNQFKYIDQDTQE